MILSEIDRAQVWRGLMRFWSRRAEALSVNKADLQAAVDATDTWIENNQVSFNTALPAAAKNNLTQSQKTLLFCAVAARRVSLDFAKTLFGGLD